MTEASVIPYMPQLIVRPARVLAGYPSAWYGIESILADLLDHFDVQRGLALEFGTEYGHSAIAFSNYFDRVISVDDWSQRDVYAIARENVLPYENIMLVRRSWQEFCGPQGYLNGMPSWVRPDLIHIDANHGYEEVWGNGLWACAQAPVVLFHDTIGFPEVRRAVLALAERCRRDFHEYQQGWGLGILT